MANPREGTVVGQPCSFSYVDVRAGTDAQVNGEVNALAVVMDVEVGYTEVTCEVRLVGAGSTLCDAVELVGRWNGQAAFVMTAVKLPETGCLPPVSAAVACTTVVWWRFGMTTTDDSLGCTTTPVGELAVHQEVPELSRQPVLGALVLSVDQGTGQQTYTPFGVLRNWPCGWDGADRLSVTCRPPDPSARWFCAHWLVFAAAGPEGHARGAARCYGSRWVQTAPVGTGGLPADLAQGDQDARLDVTQVSCSARDGSLTWPTYLVACVEPWIPHP